MANGFYRKNKRLVGVLIGAVVVALAVLTYYQRSREPVAKIDIPSFPYENLSEERVCARRQPHAGGCARDPGARH